MSRFFEDYDEARTEAQRLANATGQPVRLKRVTMLGKGYSVRIVPRVGQQFGRDLEGELVMPEEKGPGATCPRAPGGPE